MSEKVVGADDERPKRTSSGELTAAIRLANDIRAASKKAPAANTSKSKKKVAFENEKQELSAGAIKRRDMTQTSKLRLTLAVFAIAAVSVQLVVANVFFGFYLWHTRDSGVDTAVMIAWLSATVVEVIGIVVIVARNLFPSTRVGARRSDFRRLLKIVEKQSGS